MPRPPLWTPACCPADCTAALLCTDLLESSRFDPTLLRWLLDRGAGVAATPLLRASGDSHRCLQCQAGSACSPNEQRSDNTSSCSCLPAMPATALLLQKLQRELHASRQLSKLHVAAGSGQEQWLLQRAGDSLTLLLAAGAPPVGDSDPTGALAAAVAGMQPADWAAVRPQASCPPPWSPATHHLFPRPFRRAARQVLLVGRRGFHIAGPPGGSGGGASGRASRQQQQQYAPLWLDGNMVYSIVRQLAPCRQL